MVRVLSKKIKIAKFLLKSIKTKTENQKLRYVKWTRRRKKQAFLNTSALNFYAQSMANKFIKSSLNKK